MKSVKDVIWCVMDSGLFPHIAVCLAEQSKHVYYTTPHEVMEKIRGGAIGDGFENITRVSSLWDVKDRCDGFCFPDTGFSGEQKELVSQGLPVWGHHGADELESMKGLFLKTLGEVGMDVPQHAVIQGMDALEVHLFDKEDKYIKISRYRGDWETFHWRNYTLDAQNLICHAYHLWPVRNKITFYVFDAIEAIIEDGTDTQSIDGKWPTKVLHAVERKDKALVGAIQDVSEIDERVWLANERFGPVLAKYGYRGPFSTEIRITEDKVFFNDPTCRSGSPPSQLQTALITNYPEIMWAGANGEVVEPEAPEPIGAQVLITSDREKDDWLTFEMPKELRPYIKSAFSCEVDGNLQILPNFLENWAGWLVATGDELKDVVDRLKERVSLLPSGFDCDMSCIVSLLSEMEQAKGEGIEITDSPAPTPEIILDAVGK